MLVSRSSVSARALPRKNCSLLTAYHYLRATLVTVEVCGIL
ncbi:hypothetical protein [Fervidibacter sacchari]